MARDWALIEFRPGRYAKISPDGEFLGMATEAEVRAWFGAGEPARKSSVRKPPRPLPTGVPPQILTERPSPDRPSASPKPATPPEESKPTPTPSAATQPEQSPAALFPRTEPKPLPPFLEHLRGAPEPIITPEPQPVQEPKPLPPFLIRKLDQEHPREAPAGPEGLTPSPAVAAEAPPGPPLPDPIVRAPEVHTTPEEPAPEEPESQEPSLDLIDQPLEPMDLDRAPEETEPIPMPIQGVLLPEEPDEDWLDEEDQEEEDGAEESLASFSGPSGTSSSRPASVESRPAAEPSVSPDGAGRWLWLDPRQDAGHNPPSFDLAAFLQRAIDLFQSKEWTGGQKPGRLAIHPDQTIDGLSALAESLGLEVECDPLVNPGTYRLALPKDKTR